jgi:hypothetical protein
MFDPMLGEEIDDVYGVPTSHISCPGCGKRYKGKVCEECEECSKCCSCEKPKLIPAAEMIEKILED